MNIPVTANMTLHRSERRRAHKLPALWKPPLLPLLVLSSMVLLSIGGGLLIVIGGSECYSESVQKTAACTAGLEAEFTVVPGLAFLLVVWAACWFAFGEWFAALSGEPLAFLVLQQNEEQRVTRDAETLAELREGVTAKT